MCDIHNNVESCDYDGGDCCGPNVITLYCTVIYNYTFSINNPRLTYFVTFAVMCLLGVGIFFYHNNNYIIWR